jgi:hypothetical protein
MFGVLMPLSTVFQLYHGSQFFWWRKPEYQERTTDPGQATGKLNDIFTEKFRFWRVAEKLGGCGGYM